MGLFDTVEQAIKNLEQAAYDIQERESEILKLKDEVAELEKHCQALEKIKEHVLQVSNTRAQEITNLEKQVKELENKCEILEHVNAKQLKVSDRRLQEIATLDAKVRELELNRASENPLTVDHLTKAKFEQGEGDFYYERGLAGLRIQAWVSVSGRVVQLRTTWHNKCDEYAVMSPTVLEALCEAEQEIADKRKEIIWCNKRLDSRRKQLGEIYNQTVKLMKVADKAEGE